jgi:transporter family-2 protein
MILALATLLLMLAAALAGAASTVQATANAFWKQQTHLSLTVFINVLVAFVGGASLLLINRHAFTTTAWAKLGPSVVTGGLCGLGIIVVGAMVFPKLGASTAVALFVLGQTASALLLDHYGAMDLPTRPISPVRIVGIVLVLAGMLLTRSRS